MEGRGDGNFFPPLKQAQPALFCAVYLTLTRGSEQKVPGEKMNSSDPPGIAKLAEAAATSCTSLHILYPIFLILINPNHPPHQKWLDRTQPRVLAPLTSQIPPCLGLIPQRGQQAGKDFGMSHRKNMCPLPPEHEASSQISDFSLHYLPMGCSTFVYSHSQHKTMET